MLGPQASSPAGRPNLNFRELLWQPAGEDACCPSTEPMEFKEYQFKVCF